MGYISWLPETKVTLSQPVLQPSINGMKTLIAAFVLTVAAAAQNTNTVMHAADPLNTPPPQTVTVSPGAPSSSSPASSLRDPMVPLGSGSSFAEIPADQKAKKPVVVPASLQGNSTEAEGGLNPGVNNLHADATKAPPLAVGLHFNDLADGTDPVSATVRHFQMFCNSHTMQQDEAEVRQWVKANQNIVASSPSEMLRKKQFPEVRDQLIGLKFPKEWFEGGTGASPVQK